jgi:hypothetical protein
MIILKYGDIRSDSSMHNRPFISDVNILLCTKRLQIRRSSRNPYKNKENKLKTIKIHKLKHHKS